MVEQQRTASTQADPGRQPRTLVLVGQPNVGKSLIFSRLTGRYVSCSNYPGTTVELYRGEATLGDDTWRVVDTPGMMDLGSSREDEQVTRDVLLFGEATTALLVLDAKNLERGIGLLLQIADVGLPIAVALNMADERRQRGLDVDVEKLQEVLGVPVVETVATTGDGIDQLREAILRAAQPRLSVPLGDDIEGTIAELRTAVLRSVGSRRTPVRSRTRRTRQDNGSVPRSARALSRLLLALPEESSDALAARAKLDDEAVRELTRLRDRVRGPHPRVAYDITIARQIEVGRLIAPVASAAMHVPPTHRRRTSGLGDRLASWTVHPVWGIAVLAVVLYAMYQFVGVFGAQFLVGIIEETIFGEWIIPAVVPVVETLVPFQIVRDALIGEFGLITMALTYAVALILPIVTTFFLTFGILEDSGYFPRLTVVAHRTFRRMGLSGQAVLPMILGLSCDTMATVTARVLETRKERTIATLLLALGVPCSAQLAVLLAMGAAISPTILVAVLTIVAVQILLVGRLAAAIIPGESSPFIMELPPLRWPQMRNVVAKTRLRLVWYVTEVLPLFVIGTFALFVLDATGLLAMIRSAVRPIVIGLLSLPEEAGNIFVMGFFRRDYGAAGLYTLQQNGQLDYVQTLVSLVVITLFVPCIANVLVILRERGWRTAGAIVGFILPYSIVVGTVVNFVARRLLGG